MERDQASKFINDLLRLMVSRNGSDLFLTAGFPPAMKITSLARLPNTTKDAANWNARETCIGRRWRFFATRPSAIIPGPSS